VSTNATAFEALQCMDKCGTTCVLVNNGQQMVGIFTGTDYITNIIRPGLKSKNTKIVDVMHKDIIVGEPHYTVIDCINLMLQHRILHLPIGDWRHALLTTSEVISTASEEKADNKESPGSQLETDSPFPVGVVTAYSVIDYLNKEFKSLTQGAPWSE